MFANIRVLVLSALVVFPAITAKSEHTVGTGAGYAEDMFFVALNSFVAAEKICAESVHFACRLTQEQKVAAKAIAEKLPPYLKDSQFVTFKSEADSPKLFPPGERVPYVFAAGEPLRVIINRTLLYRPSTTGIFFPISFIEIYSITASFLGAKFDTLSDIDNREMGATLGRILHSRLDEIELGTNVDSFRIYDPLKRIRVLNLKLNGSEEGFQPSEILLHDSETMLNLTKEVTAQPWCGNTALEAIEIKRPKVAAMVYQNNMLTVTLALAARVTCADDPQVLNARTAKLVLKFKELVVPKPRNVDDRAFRFHSQRITDIAEAE